MLLSRYRVSVNALHSKAHYAAEALVWLHLADSCPVHVFPLCSGPFVGTKYFRIVLIRHVAH